MTPVETLHQALEVKGCNPRPSSGGKFSAKCPGHPDRSASLGFGGFNDGGAWVKCHAGCEPDAILKGLNMTTADLQPKRQRPEPMPKTAKAYPTMESGLQAAAAFVARKYPGAERGEHWLYHKLTGAEHGAILRINLPTPEDEKRKKEFRPLHCIGAGWCIGDGPGLWPLYRLPKIAGAESVNIFEGEGKSEVAASCGMAATATVHGAKAAAKTDYSPLAKVGEVNIWPDNDSDKTSEGWAADVAGHVRAVNPDCIIKIVRIAEHVENFPDHGDFADFAQEFRDGRSDEDIRAEVEGWIRQAEPVKDADAGEPEAPSLLEPVNFADLLAENPQRGPAIIDGLLRTGAVGTLIGGSKTRKSWLVAWLIAAALTGGEWLGHPVAKCRVLVIDGELTRATILFRLRKVFEALGIPNDAGAGLDLYDLRGHTKDAGLALNYVRSKGPGHWGLIVLDPLYTLYPPDPRFSENDNAAMRRLFDDIISLAGATDAAVLTVHHLSKGSQAEKGLTDLGAGAGAIARAGDAHLALRPHRDPDHVVFDGVVRDFPEISPSVWRFSFPLYHAAPELDPLDLAGLKRKRGQSTAEFLAGGKATKTEWTAESFAKKFITGEGRTLARLQAEGEKEGIKAHRAKALADQAVALGVAHVWPGKPGMNGTAARYANIPCPVTESGGSGEREIEKNPPTPPRGPTDSGAGEIGRDTHTPKGKRKRKVKV